MVPRPLFPETGSVRTASSLNPLPPGSTRWAFQPQSDAEGGTCEKYVGLRNSNLIFFFFSVKRMKIEHKPYYGRAEAILGSRN